MCLCVYVCVCGGGGVVALYITKKVCFKLKEPAQIVNRADKYRLVGKCRLKAESYNTWGGGGGGAIKVKQNDSQSGPWTQFKQHLQVCRVRVNEAMDKTISQYQAKIFHGK